MQPQLLMVLFEPCAFAFAFVALAAFAFAFAYAFVAWVIYSYACVNLSWRPSLLSAVGIASTAVRVHGCMHNKSVVL